MEQKIEKFIENNPDWYVEEEVLVAGYEFESFKTVKTVVSKIMDLAERLNHHPEVTFTYKTIKIKTVTHDVGNKITDKDFELAKLISKVVY